MGSTLEATILISLVLLLLMFFVSMSIGLCETMLNSRSICKLRLRDNLYPASGQKKADPSTVLETSDLLIDIYGNLQGRGGDFKEILSTLK